MPADHARLLLVDDDRDLVELMGEFLTSQGFFVATPTQALMACASR